MKFKAYNVALLAFSSHVNEGLLKVCNAPRALFICFWRFQFFVKLLPLLFYICYDISACFVINWRGCALMYILHESLLLQKFHKGIDSQLWSYGVTVSTKDFKSFSRGSIPRGTSSFFLSHNHLLPAFPTS